MSHRPAARTGIASAQRDTLLTAASSMLATIGAAVLSILFLRAVGPGSVSDGVLAALSVYMVVVLFCATLRIVAPGWALTHGDVRGDRIVQVVTGPALGVGLAIALLSPALSRVLAEPSAVRSATEALAILGWCGALQLIGAAQSASLQLKGRFGVPALAYALGSAAGVISFVLLEPALGATAMPVAFLGNGLALVGTNAGALRLVPRPAAFRSIAAPWRTFLLGGGAVLTVSACYVVSNAFIHDTTGDVTVLAYAWYVQIAIFSVLGSSLVTVAASGTELDVATVGHNVRLAALAIAPAACASVWAAAPVVGWMLDFDATRTDALARALLALAPLPYATTVLALGVSLAIRRHVDRRLTRLIVAALAGHVVLCAVLDVLFGQIGPVIALAVTPAVASLAVFAIVGAGVARSLVAQIVSALLRYGALAAVTGTLAEVVRRVVDADSIVAIAATQVIAVAAYGAIVLALRESPGSILRLDMRRTR